MILIISLPHSPSTRCHPTINIITENAVIVVAVIATDFENQNNRIGQWIENINVETEPKKRQTLKKGKKLTYVSADARYLDSIFLIKKSIQSFPFLLFLSDP